MLFRLSLAAFAILASAPRSAQAATPSLLDEAVQKWTAENAEWAFTQRVRSLDDSGQVKEERLERYDPSLPDHQRWRLLKFNGSDPTEEQRERWEHRKNRKPRKRANKPPGEYFDFEKATLAAETAQAVCYGVPLRPETTRLIQVEKLIVEVTVNKENRAIEHVSASLRDPMKIALGLAKVTDLDFEVHFDSDAENSSSPSNQAQATGSAQATLSKLGNRAEYAWSDFKKVTAYSRPGSKTGANEPATETDATGNKRSGQSPNS